jgi:hypothetical protein
MRTIDGNVTASWVSVSVRNHAPFSAFDLDFPLPSESTHQGFGLIQVFLRFPSDFRHGERIIR